MLFSGLEFPLPDWAADAVRAQIAKLGIDADFAAARFDLYGNVSADSVRARFKGTPEDFFRAEKISASFWIPSLLGGNFEPRALRVIDAALASSVSGASKSPAVSSLSADVRAEGGWWRVGALSMRLGALRISASGYANRAFSPEDFFRAENGAPKDGASQKKDAPLSEKNFAKSWDEIFAGYPELKKYIDMASLPALDIAFMLYEGGCGKVSAKLISSGASFSVDGADLKTGGALVSLFYEKFDGNVSASAEALAEEISGEGLPYLGNVSVRADLEFEESGVELKNLDASAGRVEYDGCDIGSVRIGRDSLIPPSLEGEWFVFASKSGRRLSGSASVSENLDVSFSFEGCFDPQLMLEREELADIPELKQLDFPRGVNVFGSGFYSRSSGEIRAEISAEAEDCLIMDIPVKVARGDVSYSSADGVMRAADLRVSTHEGWDVSGEYIQNLETNHYFVRVWGDIRPMAISHFMEKWWGRIMKDFKFAGTGNFPTADVFVEGTWGKPEYIWCFAHTEGKNASYNGADFTEFSLNVLVNPSRISLYDIEMKSPSGSARAALDWLYDGGAITAFDRQLVVMDSTLSPRELSALGGSDAADVFDALKFENPPKIFFNGIIRNPRNNPGGLRDVFNVRLESFGKTSIEGAQLENLSFSARSDKILTVAENLAFGFCSGTADGSLVLEKKSGSTLFDLSLRADKLNQKKFLDFISSIGGSAEKNSAAPNPAEQNGGNGKGIVDDGENGVLSLSARLSGDTARIAEIKGSGYAALENADLVKLHLFGVLSRALSSLKLPLGSFDITYAQSPFEIGAGSVKFPKLEMGGPVMQIRGAAGYDFVKDDIDASLAVIPFGGLTNPIFSSVASLVNPLASAVQVKLDGSLDDPKVGVSVKPANIIKSEDSIVEKIREGL